MEGLQLNLFGKPEVVLNGIPITAFESAKAPALLAFLAVTGQAHSRDTLAALLWGDLPEATAKRNLTKVLTNLRQLLGPYLLIERHSVTFNHRVPAAVDVALFQGAVEASALLEPANPARDLAPLRQAVSLYRGDFLEGFYVKNALAFEEWALGQREYLRELMLQALRRLTEQSARLEANPAIALAYCQRWLGLEPWQEEAHRQMMLLLAGSGQRDAALAQYESCRRVLAEEFGVEPMAETTALYDRLKASDTPPHNLLPPTTFIGRQQELGRLRAQLGQPNCRLLTLVGPGGIGKTRLAIEVARRCLEPSFELSGVNFADGVYFVNLAPIGAGETTAGKLPKSNQAPNLILAAMAMAMDFFFQGAADLRTQMFAHLRRKAMLLVLDNFEHLVEGVELLVELLQAAPDVKLLVTSRERLNLRQEWVLELEGLEYPKEEGKAGRLEEWKRGRLGGWKLDDEGISSSQSPNLPISQPSNLPTSQPSNQYSAIALFVQQAQRVRADFALNEKDFAQAVRICQLVEGTPLALELAASWLRVLSCAEITAEIERSLDFLSSSLRDFPQRHRSVRAVFEQSWRMLSEPEQAVFARLSLFRGGFRREAAQAVAGASLSTLASLVDKSLLRLTASGRYELHELLRQYGADKLAQQPQQESQGREQHSAYYCALLSRHEVELKGPRQPLALAEIDADCKNVQAAWNWAAEQGQAERLSQALEGLALCLDWHGRYEEGNFACQMAVEKLAAGTSEAQMRLLIKLLTWQGSFAWELGQSELAGQRLSQALALLDSPMLAQQDTRLEKAAVWLRLGRIALSSNREEARRRFGQSLDLYRALADPWWTAQALGWLGEVEWEAGRYAQVRQLAEESLALRQKLNDQEGLASTFSLLGWLALSQGQIEEAERYHQESLRLYRKMGLPAPTAGALRNLGAAYLFLGQFDQALTALEEALALFTHLGSLSNRVFAHILAGAARLQLGQYDQAHSQLHLGLHLAQSSGDQPGMGYTFLWLGRLALARQAYTEAWQRLHDSVTLFQALGQQDQLSTALASLGLVIYKLGKPVEAQGYLAKALQTATEIGAFLPLLLALPLAALLQAGRGEPARAVELYALTERYPFVANSRWMAEMFGRPIATAAAALPPAVVAAAQKRGQDRDLWLTAAEILAEMGASGF